MAKDWDPSTGETMGQWLERTWPGNGSPGSAGTNPSGPPQPGPLPPAAPPRSPLEDDPGYQAFRRALGLEQATAEAGVNTQIGALNRTKNQQLDQLAHTGERSRRDIYGGMEARGSLRSSETVDRVGEQRYGEGVASAALNDSTAERIAALQQALAERKANWSTQDSEQQLQALGRRQWTEQQNALMEALAKASQPGAQPQQINGAPLSSSFQMGDSPGGSMTVGKISGLSPAEAWIVQHESGGNPMATNPSSGAFGIAQFMPFNLPTYAKLAGVSNPRTTNPAEQLAMFRVYVKQRYGTAEKAKAFWVSHGWY